MNTFCQIVLIVVNTFAFFVLIAINTFRLQRYGLFPNSASFRAKKYFTTKFLCQIFTKTRENPFLLLMAYTHTFSIHASSNPSKLAFAASRTEYSLAASTPFLVYPRIVFERSGGFSF